MFNNTRNNSSSDSNKDKPNPLKLVSTPRIPTKEQRDDGNKVLREIRGGSNGRR